MAPHPHPQPFLSVIIPTLDEAVVLPALLARLDAGRDQIIVVDGGSRDSTVEIAAAAAGVVLLRGRPPRATQLNRGAAEAAGRVLFFLHADALPPPDYAARIAATLAQPGVVGGAFDLALDRHHLAARLVGWGATWRSRLTRRPYGDQGLFISRERFSRLGGFASMDLMEDLEFVHRLARTGRVGFTGVPVTVSARRWQAYGYLRTTIRNALLAGCFYLGLDPAPLSRWLAPVRPAGN